MLSLLFAAPLSAVVSDAPVTGPITVLASKSDGSGPRPQVPLYEAVGDHLRSGLGVMLRLFLIAPDLGIPNSENRANLER